MFLPKLLTHQNLDFFQYKNGIFGNRKHFSSDSKMAWISFPAKKKSPPQSRSIKNLWRTGALASQILLQNPALGFSFTGAVWRGRVLISSCEHQHCVALVSLCFTWLPSRSTAGLCAQQRLGSPVWQAEWYRLCAWHESCEWKIFCLCWVIWLNLAPEPEHSLAETKAWSPCLLFKSKRPG